MVHIHTPAAAAAAGHNIPVAGTVLAAAVDILGAGTPVLLVEVEGGVGRDCRILEVARRIAEGVGSVVVVERA